MTAAEVYERIRAACCRYHGFEDDDTLEWHIRAIVLQVLALRGALPRAERTA